MSPAKPGSMRWNLRTWYLRTKRRSRRFLRRLNPRRLNYSRLYNIEVDGIDTSDYPDFCDAFISSANYKGWFGMRECTEAELERLNDDGDFVYEQVQERLF